MAKVSVVTGGAGGMGIDIARRLAKVGKVIVADFQEVRIEVAKTELSGLDIDYVLMDCTVPEEVKALADRAAAAGEIANVIHAAGISEYLRGEHITAEQTLKNNINGTILVDNAFIPLLGPGSNLINIASMTSYTFPFESYEDAFKLALQGDLSKLLAATGGAPSAAYTLSKVFIRWYTLSNIERVSDRGARINSVSPGVIWTPMPQAIEEHLPGSITSYSSFLPIKRLGEAWEIGALVEFLCQPGYITGADILIDGGYTNSVAVEQIQA
jgi:NAD(P)-dependent dehydrogenase (short-subunit alcohol dehydrogenase family)